MASGIQEGSDRGQRVRVRVGGRLEGWPRPPGDLCKPVQPGLGGQGAAAGAEGEGAGDGAALRVTLND